MLPRFVLNRILRVTAKGFGYEADREIRRLRDHLNKANGAMESSADELDEACRRIGAKDGCAPLLAAVLRPSAMHTARGLSVYAFACACCRHTFYLCKDPSSIPASLYELNKDFSEHYGSPVYVVRAA